MTHTSRPARGLFLVALQGRSPMGTGRGGIAVSCRSLRHLRRSRAIPEGFSAPRHARPDGERLPFARTGSISRFETD